MMYNEDELSEENESESSEKDFVLPKRKKSKGKPKSDSLTWAEAAEIVLERFDHPLPPKEVFKLIEEADLKTDVNSSAPVAVLNSVLNNQSKGANPIFYKCPTGASSYGLIKTKRKGLDKTTERAQPVAKPSKNYTDFKRENKMKQKLTPPPAAVQSAARSLKPPGQSYPAASVRVKKPLIPPGEKTPVTCSRHTPPLGSLSKAAYYERLKQQPQHRRMMGPTTSALVRPAPPFSRPPPGAALRVMPPKKRIKIDQDENDSDSSCQSKSDDFKDDVPKKPTSSKKPFLDTKKDMVKNNPRSCSKPIVSSPKSLPRNHSQTFKNNVNNNRPIGKISSKASLQKTSTSQRNQNKTISLKKPPQSSATAATIMPHMRKSSSTTSITSTNSESKDDSKQLFFVGVKFKKMKRGFQSIKDGKSDLVSPDSVLSSLQMKDLFNASTFKLLPPAYQYQLLMLLPECDRMTGKDGALRLSPYSLGNGFFSRACQEYKDKLLDGDLNTDIMTRAKQEVKTHVKLDPWKVQYFEPVYGKKSSPEAKIPDEEPVVNIKPIESSWVSFLKFAENSTSGFEESLVKIQTQMKAIAEKEEKERNEAERQRKEELVLRNKLFSSSVNKLSRTNLLQSPSHRQLSANRSSTIRNSPSSRQSVNRVVIDASKEKSKRALKRAQLLQRKKIFDKQLKDAKAKIVQEARSSIRKDDETNTKVEIESKSIVPEKTSETIKNVDDSKSLQIKSSETLTTKTTIETSPPPLDLSNSATLKKLITESESNKKTLTNTTQRKNNNSKHPASRVVHGAASFGTNSNGVCPCNVKAMFLCKQCGSAWHGDCINSDKICISCS